MNFSFLMRGIVTATLLTVLMAGTARAQEPVPEDFSIFYYIRQSSGPAQFYNGDTNTRLYPLPCFDEYEFDAEITPAQKSELYNAIMKNDLWSVRGDLTQPPDGSRDGSFGSLAPFVQGQLGFFAEGKRRILRFSEKTYPNDQEYARFSTVLTLARDAVRQLDDAHEFPDDECSGDQ